MRINQTIESLHNHTTMICLQINKVLKLQSTSPSIRLLSTSSTAHASAAASASTRSSSSSKQRSNVRNVPSLEEFLFQQRVKQVYRAVLRQIYKHHERDDLVKFMRDEFKLNANERDLNHRKYLLSLGVNRIASMSASLGLQMDL